MEIYKYKYKYKYLKYKYLNNMIAGAKAEDREPIDRLPNVNAIFEFKTNIVLLTKAVKQNRLNKENSKEGIYHNDDKRKQKKYKTSDDTLEIIVIGDSIDGNLNYLFLDPELINKSIYTIVLGNQPDKVLKIVGNIEKLLNDTINICNSGIKIVVVEYDEHKIKRVIDIKESKIYQSLIIYYQEIISKGLEDKIKFLKTKIVPIYLEYIPKVDTIINDKELLSDELYTIFLEKYSRGYPSEKLDNIRKASIIQKSIKLQQKEIENIDIQIRKKKLEIGKVEELFNILISELEKIIKYLRTNEKNPNLESLFKTKKKEIKQLKKIEWNANIRELIISITQLINQTQKQKDKVILKKIQDLDLTIELLEKQKSTQLQEIVSNFNDISKEKYKESFEDAYEKIKSKSTGMAGIEFEDMVEQNKILREAIIKELGLELNSKNIYGFNYTWGNSDIDMIFLQN